MVDLDNLVLYKQMDPSGMLGHIHDMPALCQKAWEQVKNLALPENYGSVHQIVFLGMGGSAIAGDLLSSLVLEECRIPISVHRGYAPPAFVDDDTLVIASSYSGMTEETLAAFKALVATGTKKLVMTSGGELARLAEDYHIPVFMFDYQAPPRAAFPLCFIAMVGILQKLGLTGDKAADVLEAGALLSEMNGLMNEEVPESHNPAKQTARRLHGNLAVIYGAEYLSEVATRWKTQLNENAKTWAFSASFPELNHNDASGYEVPREISEKTLVIMLRASGLRPRIQLRFEVTGRILDKAGIRHEIIDARGVSKLAQMLSLVLEGDYISYYLAMLYGKDPYPVQAVKYLKSELDKYHV
jgi:glucose/mannose-6-phosphate isomerase